MILKDVQGAFNYGDGEQIVLRNARYCENHGKIQKIFKNVEEAVNYGRNQIIGGNIKSKAENYQGRQWIGGNAKEVISYGGEQTVVLNAQIATCYPKSRQVITGDVSLAKEFFEGSQIITGKKGFERTYATIPYPAYNCTEKALEKK